MRQRVQLGHETSNGVGVKGGEVARPVVFISQAPQDDRWMIVMLVNEVAQHVPALLPVPFAPQTAPAPGNFLPDQQAQLVAQIQHQRCLLVVSQPHEIRPHVLDLAERLAHDLVRHGRRDAGMVLVIVGAAQEQPFPVELERAVLDPLDGTHAKPFGDRVLAVTRFEGQRAAVKRGRLGGPALRRGEFKRRDFAGTVPRGEGLRGAMRLAVLWVGDHEREFQFILERAGIVQPGPHFHRGPPRRLQRGFHVHALEGHGRHVHERDVAIQAAVAVEVAQVGRDAFGIAGIITPHGQRDGTVLLSRGGGQSLGNVHRPFIIAAAVLADLPQADKHLGMLARALEVQEGPPVGKGVGNRDPGPIPARPLVIARVRVHRIPRVETMRQRHRRPRHVVAGLLAAPDFPHAAQRALVILPPLGQPPGGLGGGTRGEAEAGEQQPGHASGDASAHTTSLRRGSVQSWLFTLQPPSPPVRRRLPWPRPRPGHLIPSH